MTPKKQMLALLFIYIALRAVSFVCSGVPGLDTVISGAILLGFMWSCLRHPEYAEWILVIELLLGGSGQLLQFYGVTLRTCLLALSVFAWLALPTLRYRWKISTLNKNTKILASAAASFLIFAALIGYYNGHTLQHIYQDAIPFAFFFLILPTHAWYVNLKKTSYLYNLLLAFAIGTAIFTLFTFILYTVHLSTLQDAYYHWFRDAALGKITDLGSNFFRIVLPEHLLVVPLLLILKSYTVTHKNMTPGIWLAYLSLILILSLDITRTYILALIFGMLFTYKHIHLKTWLLTATSIGAGFIFLFTLFHGAASGFTSPGWELLGVRFGSIVAPNKEISASLRMAILPSVIAKIQSAPIIGSGLGATIKNPQPGAGYSVATFDWGYLELWIKLGLFGAISYLLYLISSILAVRKTIALPYLSRGLTAASASLFLMTIFSSALFHVLGIGFFVFLIILSSKTKNPREQRA